ncbi:hypothetical protein ABC502_15195 [Alkalimonas sp. NCh-2]
MQIKSKQPEQQYTEQQRHQITPQKTGSLNNFSPSQHRLMA